MEDGKNGIFAIFHLHANALAALNQLLEVFRLLERLFGGASRFSLLWRTQFSCRFLVAGSGVFLTVRSGVTEIRDGSEAPPPSASP